MIRNLALVNVKTILPSLPSHFPPLPPSSPFTIHHLSLPPPPTSIPLRRKSDITKSSTYASQPRNFSVQCRHHVGVDLSAHQYYWLLANTIICMCLLWYYRFKWICKNWIVGLSRSRSRSSETALKGKLLWRRCSLGRTRTGYTTDQVLDLESRVFLFSVSM